MKINLKDMHDAYLARREAQVEVDAALKAKLHGQLFPQRRSVWLMPAFAMVAMVALVLVSAKPEETALTTPGIKDNEEPRAAESTDNATTDEFYLFDLVVDEPVVLDDDQVVPGIRGSYCDDTMCVDMVAPWDGQDADFKKVSAPLVLKLPRAASNVSFGLRAEGGAMLRCAIQSEQIDNTTYRINDCGGSGQKYFLDITIWWADGGDASYAYPIEVE